MAGPWRDVGGVRVEPGELRFPSAVPGRRYRAALSVHNRRAASCRLQLLPPRRPQFKLIVENPGRPVASGLKVTAIVEYYPDSEEDLHDRLLLLIDEDIIDIPLLGLVPCCYLEIEPEINFGTVIVNSKIINKEISITNHGSSPGTFKLSYDGVVLVNIEPTSGVVEPKTVKMIEVGICTDVPRIINEVIKVELEGRDCTETWIKAVVVEQVLKVLGVPHGNELKCIHFGSVYFGSAKTEQVFLYNKSPECMDWVAVLEDNATGGEMGTDLQKATDALLGDLSFMSRTRDVNVSTLILCIPNQGTLLPYQKSLITLCFSPTKFKRATGLDDSSAKQDYVLFLRFQAAGSKGGFLQSPSDDDTLLRMNHPPHMELALIGSGLPVMLTFNPGPVINFTDCFLGEKVEVLCKVKNESESLPVTFSFQKTAHFNISPEKGKIKKHSTKEVIFSFSPRQIGVFKKKQLVDIIGSGLEENNSQILKTKSFHQIHLRFIGVCKSKSKSIPFKMNSGIIPMISTPAGQIVPDDTGQCTDIAPMAMLKSTQTQIHTHQRNRNCKNDALVALPDDRSASIRPFERHKKYRTIFTKTERYNYVDPQFSYTDFEQLEKEAHKEYYTDYICKFRQRRLQKDASRQFDAYNNSVNIGLKPAHGLISPKISIADIQKEESQLKMLPSDENCLLTSRKLEAIGSKSSNEEIWNGLNAVPISAQEKEDCSLTLTPKQLHQIHIGPSTINFGDVCVQSTSTRRLHIINNLLVHIWVQIDVEPEELQQTSPLSQVVPPLFKAYIPVVFETNTLGTFQKSFTYTINNGNTGHVLVTAKAVSVELELSAKEMILNPIPGYLAETEFRRTIRIYNRRNYPAEFSWKPIIADKNTPFSIRPSKGVVEPYRDLECEVVWHSAFHSPDTGEFNLCVHQGNTIKLKCFAKLGPTSVQFIQQRIHFNHAPLGLCTCKTAILQNIGYNHAYFQVLDLNPLPGMIITPPGGVIPVGGHADLKISFTPNAKMNFDTRVEVAVRNSRVLVLRITGCVEVPEINISVELFDFDGVYVGSTKSIPFLLQNKKQSCTRVEFDLSKYKDFVLNVNDCSVVDCCPLKPHLYFVYLEGKETLPCSLSFMPKEVAAYDFALPVNIPQGEDSWSQESSITATPIGSVKHIISPRPQVVTVPAPVCRVKAVVLTSPLEFSSMELTFSLHLGNQRSHVADESLNSQKLDLMNISRQQLTWKLTCDSSKKAKEDDTFKFNLQTGFLDPGQKISIPVSFCPPCPGAYASEMLVYVNDNPSQYRITLSGIVKSPKISFDPIFLMLTPVPLGMESETTVNIIPQDYLRQSRIQVELPEFDHEDGERICPFSVQFPNGQDIVVSSDGTNIRLICHIGFSSSRPVSYLENIFFIDEEQNRFSLQVAAVAENCLLTLYPYLAFHRSDQQIIFKSNENDCSTSEAVLDLCVTPQSVSSSTSSASFGVTTTSTYEDSISEADTISENEYLKMSESDSQSDVRRERFELSLFPDEKEEEYIFFQKVLTAVQNWFSLFGWSKGPNPISIPYSLRRDVHKVQMSSSELFKQNLGKDTVHDMLFHLSGQLLPSITSRRSLSSNPTRGILQLCWQYSALLDFLESQGAYLPHVMPEFLLDPDDYRKWITAETFRKVQMAVLKKGDVTNLKIWSDMHLFMLEKSVFEKMSKRAWTDLLLQVYKILVLPRISSHNITDLFNSKGMQSMPRIKSEPLSSNIYSAHERIILIWLNKHYEKNRKIVWKDCQKGEIPPMRWIINFDRDLLDGLVLAAQLAAYCPYLIATHFVRMYTTIETPQQCLHNCLILVDAMHAVSLAIGIKATDICDPNPIMMLILCVYLYERLPYYLPKKTIEFTGAFHATVVKKVHLENPSNKTLMYNVTLVGREADDFSLPEGNTVIIPPKGQASVNVEFTSRFLHPAEALLLLVSKTVGGIGGATLAFALKSNITHIEPADVLECKSPCYELKKVTISVTNPFRTDGIFRVILLESTSYLSQPEQVCQAKEVKQGIFTSENNVLSHKESAVPEDTNEEQNSNVSDQSHLLLEFFSPMEILCLEGSSSADLEIDFLPFNLEKRYCTVFLVNEQKNNPDILPFISKDLLREEIVLWPTDNQIGEFVYLVEGQGDLPLPSPLLPMDSPNVLNVSSTLEGLNRMEPILRMKCGLAQTLEENLRIPLVNEAREMALAIAAQQQMSALEYERRKITGTLESSSVRVAVALLGLSRVERDALLQPCKFPPELKSVDYKVQVNMQEFFQLPEKVSVTVQASSRVHLTVPSEKDLSPQKTEKSPAVELPVKFIPKYAGRYCCQILLKSSCDVRLYMIECIVNTDCAEAELEFLSPAYQAVIQDIPIRNTSHQDWKLEAVLEGQNFYGPRVLYVGPGETVQYPLMFKPIAECITMGRLILRNDTDGTENIFSLKGIGKNPPAVDHIVVDCQVRQVTQKELKVPNYTKNRLTYKVSSDLLIVGGPPSLTVGPGDAVSYPLTVSPWKRGTFEGIISFVAEDEDQQQSQHNSSLEKTDGEQALQKLSAETPLAVDAASIGGSSSGCKVWFSLKINSTPARPERKISVKCRALDTTGIDIPITNPTDEFLHLNVMIENHSLYGKKTLILRPKQAISYRIRFSPVAVGTSDASVIFLSEVVGEFWYALKLIVEKPLPTTLPEIECELGKWVRLYIPVFNPTCETLELEIFNSNPSNFSIETDPKQPLIVTPHSRTKVPVKFCPSALGRGKHKASIIFKCPELQEWLFYLSGNGLLPQLMEPTSISTCLDQHSSVIISFRNPAPENVLVDVELTVQEQSCCQEQLTESAQAKSLCKKPAFSLLLKQTQGIALGPRRRLDIPVLFIPNTMKFYEAQVVIHVTRENGKNWPCENIAKLNKDLKSITMAENGGIRGIRWIYPVHGIPEAPQQKSVSAVVRCRARHRIEQRVEVLLTGIVHGATAGPAGRNDARVNINKPANIQDEVQVTSGFSTTVEFQYELQYQSDKIKSQLDPLVGIHLMQKKADTDSGIVTLIFNIVFSPKKPMRNAATLVVQGATGGIWKFPLLFIAMEPEVDDVINIEAAGLNKESVVGFRLTSQRRYPEPFTAYFQAGSDPAFAVVPQAGELLPIGTVGTSIMVIFKPRMYGRKHRATLVIQIPSMQWTYEINGLPPQTPSPTKQAKVISTSSYIRSATVRQRNFLRENLELTTTAVCSPVKGAPLVLRTTQSNL